MSDWHALPLEDWKDTYATLHMYAQVVGKVRLALTPRLNHWWNVPLYVHARGLTTSAMPWEGGVFEICFDFLDHALVVERDDGASHRLRLEPRTVADFYREVRRMLRELSIEPKIWRMPVEIPDPIPFDQDRTHSAYDPERAAAFWRVLVAMVPVFEEFRAGFLGKSSPVHFFWGSFDLASTRFSGRRAPERPGADAITREAYSHEVWSAGFWPGGAGVAGPAFYAYAAPEPPGFSAAAVRPAKAFYHPELKEFLLMYDDVRRAISPRDALLDFLGTTYEAAAELGRWDRGALER
ncbi:MAG TPA: DUF5996 family protein [Thermoanaerobaculia bacterium]|nr:DUF5996 family protein [Thermoanaerobaculia bacterium]